MRRIWMGSLVLSLSWMSPGGAPASAGRAGEIVARSTEAPVGGAPIASSVASASAPATLGRPRIVPEGAACPGLLPVSCHEAPETPTVAPTAGRAGSPAALSAVPVPPTPATSESGDEPSTFAIERVAYFEPAAHPLGQPTPVPSQASPVPPPPFVDVGAPTMDWGDGNVEDGAGPPARFYASAEYLFWWTKNDGTPPLVTTSSNPFDNGILGQQTTQLLFGGPLDHDLQQGARFRLGYWFDPCKPMAIEGSFFFLSPRSSRFNIASGPNGTPLIGRPFFDVNNQMESVELVASPLTSAGQLQIQAPSRFLGSDLNLRCPLCCAETCTGGYRVDLLGGFRYLRLNEGLYITEIGQNFPTEPRRPNQAFRIDDRFDTTNAFYGGQIGVTGELRRGRWSFETRGLVALGDSHQVLNINGAAAFAPPFDGVPARQPGGLLALPGANIGRFSQDRFAVVPELGLTLGYQVTEAIKVTAGYNIIYWSSVLRPGDQIDRNLDITKIPDFLDRDANGNFIDSNTGRIIRPVPGVPRPVLKEKDFWAQGLNFGLEFRY
ncbi:MAG: BBP7 family outer membrane beta-barrel protein [Planctomycetes bacterium]|nr:BBP7 family outer membrane beta-barrel protein [Planctomycetota bacterium]